MVGGRSVRLRMIETEETSENEDGDYGLAINSELAN